jgi:hypothetical protein
MKIDTTLYELYNELGIQHIMQTPEVEQFIDELFECQSNEIQETRAA